MTKSSLNTRKLVLMAMLAAMAYVAMLVTRPLPRVSGFLSYDLKDVIIAISGFLMGPLPALAVTLVVSLIEMVTVGTTGFIGFIMNVLATSAFVLPSALMYNKERTIRNAAIGLILGVLLMTLVMLAWNYIITPLYQGVPREAVAKMLIPVFLPFNLVKGGLNAGITMLLYKPLSRILKKAMPVEATSDAPGRFNLAATLVSVFVVGTCIAVFVLMVRG